MRPLLTLLAITWVSWAMANEPLVFETAEQQDRFDALTAELRCAVCQNQSLADSDAPLAHDLREEIHTMILEGMDDDGIKAFMVQRYGDFVLYRPPLRGNTMVLWLAPALLLVMGAAVAGYHIRRRGRQWDGEDDDLGHDPLDGPRENTNS